MTKRPYTAKAIQPYELTRIGHFNTFFDQPSKIRHGGRVCKLDDDWFTFYATAEGIIRTQVHELCSRWSCAHDEGECRFHPKGCECSLGACQRV